MKNSITTVYLAMAGLLLLGIGSSLLFTPHAFHGSNGIFLGSNPNLLSEIRAPGGLLAANGILALISVAWARSARLRHAGDRAGVRLVRLSSSR